MDILDQAMGVERQGENLYRAFSRDASDKGAIFIFTWLADQEKKHYDVFKEMKEGGPSLAAKKLDLKEVRKIFSGWKGERARLEVKVEQVELYRQALDVEAKSVELYEKGALMAADDVAKTAIFLSIAAEERAHLQIMENIIEFITKPDSWAENAEFGYQGEDYYL